MDLFFKDVILGIVFIKKVQTTWMLILVNINFQSCPLRLEVMFEAKLFEIRICVEYLGTHAGSSFKAWDFGSHKNELRFTWFKFDLVWFSFLWWTHTNTLKRLKCNGLLILHIIFLIHNIHKIISLITCIALISFNVRSAFLFKITYFDAIK